MTARARDPWMAFRKPHAEEGAPATAFNDNPWTPAQVFGGSFLFGPLAGGVLSGLNFARMGKRERLVPSVLAGAALFALGLVPLLLVPGVELAPGMIVNMGIAFGFLLAQRPTFLAWKLLHWRPAEEDERYVPGRLGLLFLVGLGCAAVQVGLIFLALALL
jgi:hypothetical protein